MTCAEDLVDRNEALFESVPWHCHPVVNAGNALSGENDKDFADSFSVKGGGREKESRRMWMKIQTVHDDSRSGDVDASDVCYRFLAFDLSDGSLFYQEAAAFSDISKLVQDYNAGLEFEDETLLQHLEDVVGGKYSDTEWRYSTKIVREKNQLLPSAVLGFFSFRAKLERISFDFKFDCRRVGGNRNALGKDFGFVHLSLPLYMIAQYAMASQENLLKIISKKDQEIEDYRLQNVKTSRAHLATPMFDAGEFEKSQLADFKASGMHECSHLTSVMDVYQKLMQQYLATSLEERHSRKRARTSQKSEKALDDDHSNPEQTQEISGDGDRKPELYDKDNEGETPQPRAQKVAKADKSEKNPAKEQKHSADETHSKNSQLPKKKRGLF